MFQKLLSIWFPLAHSALMRFLWTARKSNQCILKEINPECSWEGLMLKLKLQYFGHLMQSANCLEKTLMLENIEGRRRRGRQKMRRLDGIIDWKDMSLSKLWELWRTGKPRVLQSIGVQRVTHNWATEQLNNNTTIYRSPVLASGKNFVFLFSVITYMQVRKQQLELDMEQQTASK